MTASQSPNRKGKPTATTDTMPDIPWWLIAASLVLILLIGLGWWYLLPFAYHGLVQDLYQPLVSSGPVITVESTFLATPLFVFGFLMVFVLMVLILIARPLKLTQRHLHRMFNPFLWVGIVGLFFGLLAKPAAWGISTYLEGTGYHECQAQTRIDRFATKRVLVREPALCNRL